MTRTPVENDAPGTPAEAPSASPAPAPALSRQQVDLSTRVPGVSLRDEEADETLRGLIRRAIELRPHLRAEQAATEARGTYSRETHEMFADAGFYQMLQPRKYGGLELGVPAFYRVITEISRGCPSTGWCLCLGSGHALQVASYFGEQAQQEIFGASGHFVAPSSGQGMNLTITPAEGGMTISGKWRYCSGVPYSTHFLGMAEIPDPDIEGSGDVFSWFIVPREAYTILDDWGGVFGMKGSGSNSVVMENVFVPRHMIAFGGWLTSVSGPTVGAELHGNPTYGGNFMGFAEGEIAAIAAGIAYAAVDEYEEKLLTSNVPYHHPPVRRVDHPDFQRWWGTGLAWADAAQAISTRGGQLYEEYSRLTVEGIEPFGHDKAMRLNDMYFAAEELAYNTVQQLLRNGSTSSTLDGQPMQRYFRDMVTMCTRADSLERMSVSGAREYLGTRSAPKGNL